MYTLRRISSTGVEMNHAIGDNYTFIHREYNSDEFRRNFELVFEKPHVADLDDTSDDDTKNVYAFVCHHSGSIIQPLYKKQSNYIMTENGKTFSNLTYK